MAYRFYRRSASVKPEFDGLSEMIDDNTDEVIRRRLEDLRTEHRDLDDVIQRLSADSAVNQLQIGRLKKRKLSLKDQIARLENALVPDIIA